MMKMKEVWNSIYPYLEDAIDEKDSLPLKTQIVLFLVVFGICMLLAYSSNKAYAERNMNASEDYSGSKNTISDENRLIQYGDMGAYLQQNGERISDYYQIIEDDFEDDMLRMVGSNGLYGYISKYTGKELIIPSFQEATPMNKNSACVSKDGKNNFSLMKKGKE